MGYFGGSIAQIGPVTKFQLPVISVKKKPHMVLGQFFFIDSKGFRLSGDKCGQLDSSWHDFLKTRIVNTNCEIE